MDQVYMKKYIKKDVKFEKHPNLIFGIMGMIFSVLFVASLFFLYWLPFWFIGLLWIAFTGAMIYWIIQKNENTNLTKSSAFIKRNGALYYIRLGYALEGDIPVDAMDLVIMGPLDAVQSARAEENIIKSGMIREMRDKPATFSNYLTEILSRGGRNLPPYVIEFCPMYDARLEKEDSKWILISYFTKTGERAIRKYRNVYGTEMFQN